MDSTSYGRKKRTNRGIKIYPLISFKFPYHLKFILDRRKITFKDNGKNGIRFRMTIALIKHVFICLIKKMHIFMNNIYVYIGISPQTHNTRQIICKKQQSKTSHNLASKTSTCICKFDHSQVL